MERPASSERGTQSSGPHQPIEAAAYDPAWPVRFAELGRELLAGLGPVALRIDTSAPPRCPAWPPSRSSAKGPLLWTIINKADQWAQAQGWLPGPSDA